MLKAEADRRGWTAYRLSQLTGMTEQTMKRLLTGRGVPNLDTLEAVAKALDLRIEAHR